MRDDLNCSLTNLGWLESMHVPQVLRPLPGHGNVDLAAVARPRPGTTSATDSCKTRPAARKAAANKKPRRAHTSLAIVPEIDATSIYFGERTWLPHGDERRHTLADCMTQFQPAHYTSGADHDSHVNILLSPTMPTAPFLADLETDTAAAFFAFSRHPAATSSPTPQQSGQSATLGCGGNDHGAAHNRKLWVTSGGAASRPALVPPSAPTLSGLFPCVLAGPCTPSACSAGAPTLMVRGYSMPIRRPPPSFTDVAAISSAPRNCAAAVDHLTYDDAPMPVDWMQ